ncbi:UPF0280 family protein [Pacificispira sp.]|uniref:UPF0280 family protein n=1 Tax=Pacificispira sp. TaxID=2888761 RepID=UPI003BAD6336
MTGPAVARLDGNRLHLQQGPIDLIVEAVGADGAVESAYAAAQSCFNGLLEELAAELPVLRQAKGPAPAGPVARRMHAAVTALPGDVFVTPMAAVAGAVADHVLTAMTDAADLAKAYVNDGGDIAFHLTPGQIMEIGLISDLERGIAGGRLKIDAASPVRGVATSGRAGRSHSLGIADAVTVLAGNAAAADAAATLIANAVDIDHPAIERKPASALDPDSDLGDRPVTVSVGHMRMDAIARALDGGVSRAESYRREGVIEDAILFLRGESRIVGAMTALAPPALNFPD